MLKRISLRWRLTILTSLLIAFCCASLSILLSFSAYRMANVIEAIPMQPAYDSEKIQPEISASSLTPSVSSETAQQAKHDYLYESLLFTGIAMLIGGFLTYYLSGKVLEPVKSLNEQVRNINIHNLNEPLNVPSTNDEIAELTASFNNMTEKLDHAFSVQKRFSADAAHELRTPLTVMQTKLDVFQKREQHTPEEYRALTAAFQKQLGQLRSLVTELLDIANMEDDWDMQTLSLAEILEDVSADLSCVAEDKNIILSLSGEDCCMEGNPNLLYRAFYNLVENGIKYNKPGGRVDIMFSENEDHVIVSVSDTGSGIPESMKHQIFEPFFRVDKSRSREMGGAGLGLSMVDAIIKKHSGTVTVTDKEGYGSCFTVTFPKNK